MAAALSKEAGLPWGWEQVLRMQAKNPQWNGNIRCIGDSIAYWLRISPANFNAAASKRKKAAMHDLKQGLQRQRRKVKRGKRKHRQKAKAARDRLRLWLKRAKAKGSSRISTKDYGQACYTDGVGARIVLHRRFSWSAVQGVGQHRANLSSQVGGWVMGMSCGVNNDCAGDAKLFMI